MAPEQERDEEWKKPVRIQSKKEYFCPDSEGKRSVKVTRIDDGEGGKKIFQSHWNGSQWVNKCPKEIHDRIHLYQVHHPLNRAAIEAGERVIIVEGEGKADLLLALGIAATCAIGGAGKWKQYGYPNYLKD